MRARSNRIANAYNSRLAILTGIPDVSGSEQRLSPRGSRLDALRGGTVVGDHAVIFAGAGERIELSHRAEDRGVFARGALAAALWTRGNDMIEVCRALNIDAMTAHWEFTYGAARVQEAVKSLGRTEFLAQNVKTADFGDPVFKPWVMREVNGVPVAIIGTALFVLGRGRLDRSVVQAGTAGR